MSLLRGCNGLLGMAFSRVWVRVGVVYTGQRSALDVEQQLIVGAWRGAGGSA